MANVDQSFLTDEIQQRLIDDIPKIDPSSFSAVCNAIHSTGINFKDFLLKAQPTIIENKHLFSVNLIGDILLAYNQIGEHQIFEIFEQEILENKLGKTPDDIFSALQAYSMSDMGSDQLYEYFDKIVGKNISSVKSD